MRQKSRRPLSPHLGIYRPQITSVMSILHRISGLVFFFGLVIIIWAFSEFYFYPTGFLASAFKDGGITSFISGIMMIWSFSFFFYICTEIRHLIWDMGYGYELKQVCVSAWLAVITSVLLFISFWTVIFKLLCICEVQ